MFDSANRLTATIDPLNNRTTLGYDAAGNQVTVKDANSNVTTTVYDSLNRVSAVVDPLNNRTTFSYNAVGLQTEVQDANGKRTTQVYDALNRLQATIDASGNRTTLSYDSVGNQTAMQDARGNRVTIGYDAANRNTFVQDQLANRTTYTYDSAGKLSTRKDAKDQLATLTYDSANRLTGVQYQDGTRATLTFDATGQRTAMQDSTGTTTYTYDNAGRPVSVISPGPKAITYTYDNAGSRATMQDPDGGLWTYTHDAADRLTKLANPFNETTTLEYDTLHRPTILRHANGTRAEHTYDAGSRLTQLSNLKSDNTTISSFVYSLDNAGNRTGVVEANGDRVTWTYDETYQLTREQRSGANGFDITYVYDPTGNRSSKIDAGTTTTYTYDTANRLSTEQTGATVTTYSFDNNGNTSVKNAAGQLTTYTWDGENRMTGIQYADQSRNTFSYDGDGRRREKIDSLGTTRFVRDGEKVLLETDQSGTTTVVYSLSDGMYGNLLSQRRSGASRFYHPDAIGSTQQLTDATQAVTDSYLYEGFGKIVSSSGTTVNPFKYIGQQNYYTDGQSNLMLLGVRSYESSIGRFVSRDPLLFPSLADNSRSHGYLYAYGNPVLFVDPSGYWSWGGCEQKECEAMSNNFWTPWDTVTHNMNNIPCSEKGFKGGVVAYGHLVHVRKRRWYVIRKCQCVKAPDNWMGKLGLKSCICTTTRFPEQNDTHYCAIEGWFVPPSPSWFEKFRKSPSCLPLCTVGCRMLALAACGPAAEHPLCTASFMTFICLPGCNWVCTPKPAE